MNTSRLRCFLGIKGVPFGNFHVYSPTIGEIDEVEENKYHLYLLFAMFNKENIFKNLFGLADEEYEKIEDIDSFDILTSYPQLIDYFKNSISFFSKVEVEFDSFAFKVNGQDFISRDNYKDYVEIVKTLNGMCEEKEVKFKNDRVKEKYKKMMAMKKEFESKKNDSLELKDILSVLCSADGNGINIFNIGQLTIYQVYALFERLNMKENHIRHLGLWANTYTMKEGEKLPEWMSKAKL